MTWRWGIVGPGEIAERFATDLRLVPDASLTAVSSRSMDRARAFADRHAIPSRYDSLDALLEDSEVDVVYVATPNSRHAPDTLAALSAGKHVLCEKPLAVSANEAEQMVAAARAAGLFLMEGLWSRFLPSYRRLVELVADGAVGEPLLVEADFGFPVDVPDDHRLLDPDLGGGATLDLGIYPVQLASLLLGPAEHVTARGSLSATGVDDLAVAMLGHRRGGTSIVTSSLRVSLPCSARVTGDGGAIELPAFLHCPDHLVVHGPRGPQRIDTAHEGDGIRFQVHEVHRCLAAGLTESPTVPLDESIQIAQTLDAIRHQVGVTPPRTSDP
jgi:predicted dehydrogenase